MLRARVWLQVRASGWARGGSEAGKGADAVLFLLTGEVQTGKTRWLERLLAELAAEGVPSAGVVAPGVWREHPGSGSGGGSSGGTDAVEREKLGIDNVLLPGGERIPFARRRDLARTEGTLDPASQSAVAGLGWEISDAAIAQVNNHFKRLQAHAENLEQRTNVSRETFQRLSSKTGTNVSRETFQPELSKQRNPSCCHPDRAQRVEGSRAAPAEEATAGAARDLSVPTASPLPVEIAKGPLRAKAKKQTNVSRETLEARHLDAPSLLVVDELGRLELERGGGLTAAMELLARGAAAAFPHALAVVRAWLLPRAQQRFAAAWGGARPIAPDGAARRAVRAAFGLASLNDNEYH